MRVRVAKSRLGPATTLHETPDLTCTLGGDTLARVSENQNSGALDSRGRRHEGRQHFCTELCSGRRHSGIYYVKGPLDDETAKEMCYLAGIQFVEMREAPESSPCDPINEERWPYRYMLTWDESPG